MPGRPRLLVFAYACEPYRGSEPGAGWGLVMALREFADCRVLVPPVHIGPIRRWRETASGPLFDFVEVDEGWLGRLVKRGGRIGLFISYLLWLPAARRAARRLLSADAFDGAVHATYSAYWLPTPAVGLGLPSVWGPVGGGVTTPRSLWGLLGWRGIVGEIVDLAAVRVLARLPATRRTWRLATVRVVQNGETLSRLPAALRADTRLLNHALFHTIETDVGDMGAVEEAPYVLWAGLLESRKGPEIAVRAVAATADVRMIVVGDGPERSRMERLAAALGGGDRVRFDGWVDHARVLGLMRGARAVVFTGMREEGGLGLAEALLIGAPIVVLDNGGAGHLAHQSTDQGLVRAIAPHGREATIRAFAAALDECWLRADRAAGPLIDQQAAVDELEAVVRQAVDG
jgi:glycosyltransferase involved in cell wall biosynthesis